MISSLLRSYGVDATRLGQNRLTYRLLEHDLPILAGTNKPIIFDIGANKGQTVEMMLRIFRQPRIYSFEPSPKLADALKSRFAPQGITIEEIAMGATMEERSFIHYTNNELSSFLELTSTPSNPFATVAEDIRQTVSVSTVDHYCGQTGISNLDILKIDTQGFDLEVLKGAIGMLSRACVQVVQVEINFEELYKNQCTAGQLIDWLGTHGYLPVAFYETARANFPICWATACFARPKSRTGI